MNAKKSLLYEISKPEDSAPLNAAICRWDISGPGWLRHSGTTVQVERLLDGKLLASSLQSTGVPVKPKHEKNEYAAFLLEIDGESMNFDWELVSSETINEPTTGWPGDRVVLCHTRKPVEVTIDTAASGEGLFRRRISLRNTAKEGSWSITSVSPLSTSVWNWSNGPAPAGAPFAVGRFQDIEWGREGNFVWDDLPVNAELVFGSDRGRSGFGSPWLVCRNQISGGFFLLAMAWSANWQARLRTFNFENTQHQDAMQLRASIGPTGTAPLRLVSAGETVALPEVHFGMGHDDLDTLIQSWHRHLRGGVLTQDSFPQPVILNHWGYMEHELNEPRLQEEVKLAAEVGAELFMVDAGWFGNQNEHWYESVGDWQAGDRLPNDLYSVFDHARSCGLAVGLWVEIEAASKESALAKTNPDWFLTRYGKPVDRLLDLSKPEVAAHIEAVIIDIVERYRLDMFRLDYNTDALEGGFNLRDGLMENTLWRHVEVIYGIFGRLKTRFPKLQLENCCSGGGRTDLGMVSRFTTAWVSDWMRMPRTVRILNGMSMALPPERINRMFGVVMEGSHLGNLDTQLHVLTLCHPSLSGLTPTLAQANPMLLDKVKLYLGIYKDFIRPFHRQSKVFHHTPVIPGKDSSGWCAMELAAADGTRAVAGVFRLADPAEDDYIFKPRGLAADRLYQIRCLPSDRTWVADGHDLIERGITVRLESPLTSRLFLFSVITDKGREMT